MRPNLEPIVGDMVNILWTSAAADAEVEAFVSHFFNTGATGDPTRLVQTKLAREMAGDS